MPWSVNYLLVITLGQERRDDRPAHSFSGKRIHADGRVHTGLHLSATGDVQRFWRYLGAIMFLLREPCVEISV